MDALCRQWADEHAWFEYIPVLSFSQDSNWQGRTGRVLPAVHTDHQNLSGYQVYACGTPKMVKAAQAELTSVANLPAEKFFSDAFVSAHHL